MQPMKDSRALEPKGVLYCLVCGERFTDLVEHWVHTSTKHEQNALKCLVCDKSGFMLPAALASHLVKHQTLCDSFTNKGKTVFICYCEGCGERLNTIEDLISYGQTAHIHNNLIAFPCTQCHFVASNYREFFTHYVFLHVYDKIWLPCQACPGLYTSIPMYTEHMRYNHHSQVRCCILICHICKDCTGWEFGSYLNHLLTHAAYISQVMKENKAGSGTAVSPLVTGIISNIKRYVKSTSCLEIKRAYDRNVSTPFECGVIGWHFKIHYNHTGNEQPVRSFECLICRSVFSETYWTKHQDSSRCANLFKAWINEYKNECHITAALIRIGEIADDRQLTSNLMKNVQIASDTTKDNNEPRVNFKVLKTITCVDGLTELQETPQQSTGFSENPATTCKKNIQLNMKHLVSKTKVITIDLDKESQVPSHSENNSKVNKNKNVPEQISRSTVNLPEEHKAIDSNNDSSSETKETIQVCSKITQQTEITQNILDNPSSTSGFINRKEHKPNVEPQISKSTMNLPEEHQAIDSNNGNVSETRETVQVCPKLTEQTEITQPSEATDMSRNPTSQTLGVSVNFQNEKNTRPSLSRPSLQLKLVPINLLKEFKRHDSRCADISQSSEKEARSSRTDQQTGSQHVIVAPETSKAVHSRASRIQNAPISLQSKKTLQLNVKDLFLKPKVDSVNFLEEHRAHDGSNGDSSKSSSSVLGCSKLSLQTELQEATSSLENTKVLESPLGHAPASTGFQNKKHIIQINLKRRNLKPKVVSINLLEEDHKEKDGRCTDSSKSNDRITSSPKPAQQTDLQQVIDAPEASKVVHSPASLIQNAPISLQSKKTLQLNVKHLFSEPKHDSLNSLEQHKSHDGSSGDTSTSSSSVLGSSKLSLQTELQEATGSLENTKALESPLGHASASTGFQNKKNIQINLKRRNLEPKVVSINLLEEDHKENDGRCADSSKSNDTITSSPKPAQQTDLQQVIDAPEASKVVHSPASRIQNAPISLQSKKTLQLNVKHLLSEPKHDSLNLLEQHKSHDGSRGDTSTSSSSVLGCSKLSLQTELQEATGSLENTTALESPLSHASASTGFQNKKNIQINLKRRNLEPKVVSINLLEEDHKHNDGRGADSSKSSETITSGPKPAQQTDLQQVISHPKPSNVVHSPASKIQNAPISFQNKKNLQLNVKHLISEPKVDSLNLPEKHTFHDDCSGDTSLVSDDSKRSLQSELPEVTCSAETSKVLASSLSQAGTTPIGFRDKKNIQINLKRLILKPRVVSLNLHEEHRENDDICADNSKSSDIVAGCPKPAQQTDLQPVIETPKTLEVVRKENIQLNLKHPIMKPKVVSSDTIPLFPILCEPSEITKSFFKPGSSKETHTKVTTKPTQPIVVKKCFACGQSFSVELLESHDCYGPF